MSILYQVPFGVGYVILCLLAKVLPEWRNLQMALAYPMGLTLLYYFLPESPRWLITKGRHQEAEDIIRKICKFNGHPLPEDRTLLATLETFRKASLPLDQQGEVVKKTLGKRVMEALSAIFSLFLTPEMCKRTLIICAAWFATTLVYYGLSLGSDDFADDPFVSGALMGLAELPPLFYTSFLVDYFGRMPITVFTFISSGIIYLFMLAVPSEGYSWATMTLAVVGKLSICSTFAIVYLLVAELMPTDTRSVALGAATLVSRLAAISAPFISALLSETTRIIIYGVTGVATGILCLFLPESLNQKIPATVQDVENWRLQQKSKAKAQAGE